MGHDLWRRNWLHYYNGLSGSIGNDTLMKSACYRNLRPYKYQLMKTYQCLIPFIGSEFNINTPFVHINEVGLQKGSQDLITIKEGYCWDGPSGPTIDTLNFMRGSLVHDALYQLMRMGELPSSCREKADDLLRHMCIVDGMSQFRAWYVYIFVRCLG